MSNLITEAQYHTLRQLFTDAWDMLPFHPRDAFPGRDNASAAAIRNLKALQGKGLLMQDSDGRYRMAVDTCREAMGAYADKNWRRID